MLCFFTRNNLFLKTFFAAFIVVLSLMTFVPQTADANTSCGAEEYTCGANEVLQRGKDGGKDCKKDLLSCNSLVINVCKEMGSSLGACVNKIQGELKSTHGAKYSSNEPSDGTPSLLTDPGAFFEHVLNSFVSAFLSVFIGLAGGLLAIAGTGFDQVINYTIINFSTTFSAFEPGVNAAWGGFRDIANIAMIAMFVFVAFMVILNSQTYGLKQFGVRILLIALLINFSLFFTKVMVDISNVTAIQFRNAIQVTDSSGNDAGIAAAFMHHAGITDSILKSAYEQVSGVASKSWSDAFLYTFITVAFFLALFMVLTYGLILMITRMVVLVVLMFTSSAAFAAYMIPRGQKWWDTWWSTLIKNALFAPFYMLMLWGTVNILNGMKGSGSATFADLVKNSESAWVPIFQMMIVVGLLYASTKIASELSISGAKFAQSISNKGFSLALRGSLGASLGLAGRVGRGTIGAGAARLAANERLRMAAAEGNWMQRNLARGTLAASKATAARSFDARNTKLLQDLGKKSGLSLGKGIGNTASVQKRKEEYLEDAMNAAADASVRTAKKIREETAASTSMSSKTDKGSPEEVSSGFKITSKNNPLQVGKETAPETAPEASNDNKEQRSEAKSNAGQEQQNKLTGVDSRISKLTSKLHDDVRNRYTAHDVATSIPRQRLENESKIVNAIEQEHKDSSQAEAMLTEKEIRAAARERFLQGYVDKAWTRGGKRSRERIVNKVKKNLKKTESQKTNEELQKQVDELKRRQDSQEE